MTLDSTIAAVLIFLIFSTTLYFIVKSQETPWSKTHLLRTGYDIVSLLDKMGILQRENETEISKALKNLLPTNYGMLLELYKYRYEYLENNISNRTLYFIEKISIGDSMPSPESKISTNGQRLFLVENSNKTKIEKFCIAKFKIWIE